MLGEGVRLRPEDKETTVTGVESEVYQCCGDEELSQDGQYLFVRVWKPIKPNLIPV